MLIVSELSEALEEYRAHHEINEIYYVNGKAEGVPVELADAVIRILDACGQYGVDLEAVIREKHAYNLTRPYKHGKRV
jgi:NTP pyrophosphatase (non-canonical NTP hydrolase)